MGSVKPLPCHGQRIVVVAGLGVVIGHLVAIVFALLLVSQKVRVEISVRNGSEQILSLQVTQSFLE